MTAPPFSSLKRLHKEMELLFKQPVAGIACYPTDETYMLLKATIRGPVSTPYEGGTFYLEITVKDKYPFVAPHVRFLTKVYHPNIDEEGRVCLDILQRNWSPSITIEKILLAMRSLLAQPNPTEPLMPDIARQLIERPEKFKKEAKKWTQLHATNTK